MLPAASPNTPEGLFNCAFNAVPRSPAEPAVCVPAKRVSVGATYFDTDWRPGFATNNAPAALNQSPVGWMMRLSVAPDPMKGVMIWVLASTLRIRLLLVSA